MVSMLCSEFGYRPHEVDALEDVSIPLQIADRRFWEGVAHKLDGGQQLTNKEAMAVKPYMANKRI